MVIFEKLNEDARLYPDKIVLEDDREKYTFEEINAASGRVFAYLSDKGIGKEDVVTIKMKRSARVFLAMLGVWKAGAALSVIGENSPYTDFLLKDTEPKLVFDDICYEEAMKYPCKNGCSEPDENDLACIVYSTGSTGFFKGSMHEYGNLYKCFEYQADMCKGFEKEYADLRTTFNSGFYSATAVVELVYLIVECHYVYIVPLDVLEDKEKITKYLRGKEISCYDCMPNQLSWINKKAFPHLRYLVVSYEMFGCEYDPELEISNNYGMSEALVPLTCFVVDRSYGITPVGKPLDDGRVKILNKSGKPVAVEELGEICFVPEFFRGYKNLPEKTAEVMHGGMFYTGDMGYYNRDGNIVVVGRKSDICERDEGYIIPVLISVEVQKVLNVENSYVRVFEKNGKVKICLYYISEKEYTLCEIREALSGVIPDYAIPTHCKRMKEFPYFISGKIKRLEFEEID